MIEMEMQELQEHKKALVNKLEGLTGKEMLLVSGLLDGMKLARKNAAENTAADTEKSA